MRWATMTVSCALALVGAACDREKAGAPERFAPRAPGNKPPSVARPIQPSTLGSASELIDLVHRTAVLVVSSSHENAQSRVAFLVDGLSESAWRPNPADPSPWFELQFAHEVEVYKVVVEPLDQLAQHVDMDLKIADGTVARRVQGHYEYAPDEPIRTRTLRVRIEKRGRGDSSSAPPKIALAELRVEGVVDQRFELESAIPETRVHQTGPVTRGTGREFRIWWLGAPYRSAAEMCAAYEATLGPHAQSFGEDSGSVCNVPEEPFPVEGVPSAGVTSVRLGDVKLSEGESASFLMVETDAGWSPANLWSENHSWGGSCPGMVEKNAKIMRTYFDGAVLAQDRYRYYFPSTGIYYDPAEPPSVAVRSLLRCDLSHRLECREHILAFGAPDVSVDDLGQSVPSVPKAWQWERDVTVGDSGWLRFGSCISPSVASAPKASVPRKVVPCYAPRESELP